MKTLGLGAGLVVLMGVAVACEQAGAPSAPAVKAIGLSSSAPSFSASASNHHMRWDIISVDFSTRTVSAGGVASAFANDNSKITLTGSGTFRSNPGNPQDVTGGGSWTTYASRGSVAGSGTYEVTGLVSPRRPPRTVP